MKDIGELARKFEDSLEKHAKRGRKKTKKRKRTRRQISKDLESQKKKYQDERKKLSDLEKKRDKLEKSISDCRDSMRSARSSMLNCADVLKNMDLADCKHAVFYDNDDQDVGYIIDGSEKRLTIGPEGEPQFSSMREFLLEKKRKAREEKKRKREEEARRKAKEAEEGDQSDAIPPGIDTEGEDEEDVSDARDGASEKDLWESVAEKLDALYADESPNFRFLE